MGNSCTLRLVVIGTTIITNSTLVPEAIRCCLQTSTYCCFHKGGEIYTVCIETFVHKTSILFELYGHMFCY